MPAKKPIQKEQVSVYKADTAKRRTALFFTIIGVAAVLLVVVIVNLPTRTTPPVTAPVEADLIHNKSEVIDYSDSDNLLAYKDENGRPHKYLIDENTIITKTGPDGKIIQGNSADLVPLAKIDVVVKNNVVYRVHVRE